MFPSTMSFETLLEDDRANFQALNVGGNRPITVSQYANLIARRGEVDLESQIPGYYRFGDPRHIFSDVAKLQGLGWEPRVTLEEIVDEYIDWAQTKPGFRDDSAEAAAQMAANGTIRMTIPA